jgi:hypothetical protein
MHAKIVKELQHRKTPPPPHEDAISSPNRRGVLSFHMEMSLKSDLVRYSQQRLREGKEYPWHHRRQKMVKDQASFRSRIRTPHDNHLALSAIVVEVPP